MRKTIFFRVNHLGVAILFFITGIVIPVLANRPAAAAVSPVPFTETTIATNQPSWGKQLADLDGDGSADAIQAGPYVGGISWYKSPTWTKYFIGDNCSNTDDLQVADVNNDGAPDLLATDGICWLENPRGNGGNVQGQWTHHVIDSSVHSHDLVPGDVNGDGKVDVVVRGTGEFGPTYLYLQGVTADSWTKVSLPNAPVGQGTALADIDRDGRMDIAANGYWLQQPSDPVAGNWVRRDFSAWTQGASVVTTDMNGDGRMDIVVAPSEAGQGTIAWFENPADPINGTWTRHNVGTAEDVHRFYVVDINKDGRQDIVFAEMHQSPSKRVGIFFNEGGGLAWTLQTVATTGSHNIAIGDVGNDGDVDILGANWESASPDGGALKLWRNDLNPSTIPTNFAYIQVDNARSQDDFGLTYGDMDGDARKDIISGQYWYKNPGGDMSGTWNRTDLGTGKDAMLTLDVDGDGQRDIIAQSYSGGTVNVHWLKPSNAAATAFTITNIGTLPDSPDHKSQGYATAQIVPGGRDELVFSTDSGYFYFSVPSNPAAGNWPRVQVSTEGRQEGFGVGDINGDGRLDIVGSTDYGPSTVAWWSNPGTGAGSWTKNIIGNLPKETTQIRIADINNDGRRDVVATDDDLGAQVGHVYWFEQGIGSWTLHNVGTAGSLESLDIGDFTQDGQIDIVTGDHKNAGPLETIIWANVGGGASWTKHVVDTGKESHLGTQVIDLDSDGDLDFASIAWNTNNLLHLWRNDTITGGGGGAPDVVAPVISNVSTLAVTGSSATVVWTTDEAADSQIEYGPTTAYGSVTTLNTAMVTSHNQKIGNLAPLTTYHYRVISKDAAGNTTVSADQTFTTLEAAAVAHIQNAAATGDGGSENISQSFAAQNTAGNLIVAAASWGGSGTMTCSDTRGNTYVTVTSHYDSAQNQSLAVCYAADIASGPNTVTVNFGNGAGWRRLIIHEYSGLATANPVDITAKNNANGSTAANAITSGTATTSVNGDLIFGATMDDLGTTSITAGTGFTQRNSVNNKDLATQDKVQDTAGAVASTMTFGAAHRYMAHMVAFKAANVTPPGPDVTAPTLSNIATSNVTTTAATVNWTTNEPADTQVEYGTTTAYGLSTPLNTTLTTAHAASLGALEPGTTYHYRVISKDVAGNVATSGDFTFTTDVPPPLDTTPPVISGVFESAVTADSASITWTTNEPADTQVEYGTTIAYGSVTPINTLLSTPHTQQLSGLTPSTTYHYRVLSRDAAGNLAVSADFTFTTQELPPPSSVAHIQTAANTNNGGGETMSQAFTTPNTAGNLIVAAFSWGNNSTASCTDTQGNTYAMATSYYDSARSQSLGICYASNIKSGPNTVTVSFGGAYRRLIIHEYSGIAATNPVDVIAQNNANGTTAANGITSTSATTTVNGALIFGATMDDDGVTTVTAGTGFTQRNSVNNKDLVTQDMVQANAGAAASTMTFGAADRYMAHMVAFKPGVSTPDTTAPVISGTTVSNITATSASTNWTTNEPADTQVEYGTTTAYGSMTPLNSALVTSHDATLTGLTPGTTYHYRVISKDAAGNVATSGDLTFTTLELPPPDTTPPTISDVASSTITQTGAAITWTTNETSDTQVEYGTTTAYGNTTVLAPAMVTTHNVSLTSLNPGTIYHYRVLSRDAAGNLAVSADFTFTTQELPPPDTTPPTISNVVSSNITQSTATITWTTNEPADTQVEYGTTIAYGTSTPLNATLVTNHTTSLTGLTPGATYHYRVISKDAAGNVAISGDLTFTTQAAPPVSPIAHIQTANYTSNSSSRTASRAFTTANTAGNLIVAAVSWGEDGTFTCSDTRGNTYAIATIAYDSSQGQSLGVCYAANSKSGTNTVTVTFSKNSSHRRLIIHEYSGIALASPVDVTAKNNANGSTAPNAITSGTATTTTNGSLIFGATMDDSWITTITAGTGFTQRNSVNNKDLVTQDMVQTTAGPVASTMTFGSAHRYLAHMVAFKPAQ